MNSKEIEHEEKEEKRIDDKRIDICKVGTASPQIFKRRIVDDHYKTVKIPKVEQKSIPTPSSCAFCNKKLKFINTFTCRCGGNYCNKHRFFDQHKCQFDYKKEAKEKLKELNPKVVADKISKS